MARRALTTWMHRQQELTRLLSVRHAMLVRPEPGLRVLQALGLAPDDAALDGRPRRLVRAVRVLDQRPAVRVDDDEQSADHESSPAATLHPSPARPAETAPVDMAAEGAHEFNAQSDRSADELRDVEAERIALSTPEQVPSPVVEYAAASVTQAAPAPEHSSGRGGAAVTPPVVAPPSLIDTDEQTTRVAAPSGSQSELGDERSTAAPTATDSTVAAAPASVASPDAVSSEALPDATKPTPAAATATPFMEQRHARRPSAPRLAQERSSRGTEDRDHDEPRAAEPLQSEQQHASSPATSSATPDAIPAEPAEPSASERSPLEWMHLLVEATSEPSSAGRDARTTPVARPGARPAVGTRAATPKFVAPVSAVPPTAPATATTATTATAAKTPTVARPRIAPTAGRTLAHEGASREQPRPVRHDTVVPSTREPARPSIAQADEARATPQLEPMAPAMSESVSAVLPGDDRSTPHAPDAASESRDDLRSPPTSPPEERPAAAAVPTLSTALASLTPPVPLPPSTRRFLRPLVGIDPDTVRIHRGTAAARIAAARNADALTVRDEVVLADAHDERSPTTLGILAHELTHVARARQPRFVPPIVRDAAAAMSRPVMRPATLDAAASEASGIEEEPMALRTEGAVRHAARREPGSTIDSPRPIPESIEPFTGSTRRAPLYDRPAADSDALAPVPRPARDNGERDASPWGGLPAPWEPLPEALSQMSAPSVNGAEPGVAATLNGGDGFAPATAAPAAAPAAGPAAAPVQAAARDRSVADQTAAAPAAAAAGQAIGNPPAPDIDALARQVYDVLKRRLAAERRRGG